MKKLCLSLLILASTPALVGMIGAPGATLDELITSGKINLIERIKVIQSKRTGKMERMLNLRGLGLTCIKALLKELPESSASTIDKIDLSRNYLTEIPAEFVAQFPNLRFLNLSRNSLTELPDNIGNLPLRFLSLSNNAITKLPESFAKLSALANLNLGHNCLEGFQENIFKELTALKVLKINANVGNPKRVLAMPEVELSSADKEKVNALFKEKFAKIAGSQLKVDSKK